jgi:hypothetical protein
MQTSAFEDLVVPVVLTTFGCCIAFAALQYLIRAIGALLTTIVRYCRFNESPRQISQTHGIARSTKNVPPSRQEIILANLVKKLAPADPQAFGGLGPVARARLQRSLDRPALNLRQ